MTKLPVNELTPGDILSEPVRSKTDFIIFDKGDVLTVSHINTLIQWGISHIHVERDGNADDSAPPAAPSGSKASKDSRNSASGAPASGRQSPAGRVEVRQLADGWSASESHHAPTPAGQTVGRVETPLSSTAAGMPTPQTASQAAPEASAQAQSEAQDMTHADKANLLRIILTTRFQRLEQDSPYTKALMALALEKQYKTLLSDAQSEATKASAGPAIATQPPPRPDINYLLGFGKSLGTAPLLCNRLTEAVNKPRVSVEEIASIVTMDSDLVARLLKLVNSPYYGFTSKITDIGRAITMIGMNQLITLAMSAAFVSSFKGLPSTLVSMESFWAHSICCGVGGRLLAKKASLRNPENYFIAGLLHDIARLLMYTQLPTHSLHMLSEARRKHVPLRSLERETLGITHDSLGQKFLAGWNFPPELHQLIGEHHKPLAEDSPVESLILPAANTLSQSLAYGSSGENIVSPLPSFVWTRLGLSVQGLVDLCRKIDDEYRDLRAQLNSATN